MTDQPAFETGLGPEDGADLAGAALALARRFAAGATMWCIAPEWPGARAPRGGGVRAPRDHGQARAPGRRGRRRAIPVACAAGARAPRRHPVRGVAAADEPRCAMRCGVRASWGLTTVWIGAGDPPGSPARPTTCSGWTESRRPDPYRRYDGSLVLRYHVLWELTHVCFEHPGLLVRGRRGMRRRGRASPAPTRARLAEVVTDRRHRRGAVRTAVGVEHDRHHPRGTGRPGDLVLVHAGTAIALVEADAP